MKLITDFFKNRKIPFYIGLGMAVFSVLVGIVYAVLMRGIKYDVSLLPVALMIGGGVAFGVCALLRVSRTGAGIMAIAAFASLLACAVSVYEYVMMQVMNSLSFEGIVAAEGVMSILVCGILLLVCTIVCNVLAWLPMEKVKAIEFYRELKA